MLATSALRAPYHPRRERNRMTQRRPPGAPPTSPAGEAEARLQLAILNGRDVTIHALPAQGTITLGRGEEADILVKSTSVSRVHARLHVGAEVRIEDAGSTNGTRVRDARRSGTDLWVDARHQPAKSLVLAPGDAFQIGSVQVVLQRAEPPRAHVERDGPIVADEVMRRVYAMAERAAQGTISVLLLGDTGTGKEVLAHAVHRFSPRASGPFLALSCVALSETLLESELFGHEKGAFTGATSAKIGLLEAASGGTVFLDEVGELPAALQAKLLRVLEERKILPVGSLVPRPFDVRFVSATNRDLDAEVSAGRFRRDLLYRLNGVTLSLPPLRERPSEIPLLARRFVAETCRRLDRAPDKILTDEALAALAAHPFPGNIRELENVIERAVLLSPGDLLLAEHLPFEARRPTITLPSFAPAAPDAAADLRPSLPTMPPPAHVPAFPGAEAPLKDALREREREKILEALERCQGNQTRAAVLLGISRRTLVDRLTEHGIPRPRKR